MCLIHSFIHSFRQCTAREQSARATHDDVTHDVCLELFKPFCSRFPLREPLVRSLRCSCLFLLNEVNMNTTKKVSLVSQDPFFLAALKKLPDPLRVALRDSDIDDPGLFTAFPVLSAAELGLEGTARRRRIGKRKGPGDHEPQRYDVGDLLGVTGPGPLGVTGLTTAGILGTIVSISLSLSSVHSVPLPPFLFCFLLSPFPGPRFPVVH